MAKPKEEKAKFGPWDFIKLMQNGEYNPEEHDKFYSPFLMSRILSTDNRLPMFLNMINLYNEVPKNIHFTFCQSLLKMTKGRLNSSYVAEGLSIKSRKDVDKNSIMTFFECGNNDYESILENLTDEEIQTILKYMEKNHLMEN